MQNVLRREPSWLRMHAVLAEDNVISLWNMFELANISVVVGCFDSILLLLPFFVADTQIASEFVGFGDGKLNKWFGYFCESVIKGLNM